MSREHAFYDGTRSNAVRWALTLALAAWIVPTPNAEEAIQAGQPAIDLYKVPGTLIARGTNTEPAGWLRLKTYRLEEIVLPEPADVEIEGRTERVQKALRLTITGEWFPVRALAPAIWVNDVALHLTQENVDLTELSTIVYDPSILKDGATLSVSYGAEESRSTLPEKLKNPGK